jgi:hypothetical protein
MLLSIFFRIRGVHVDTFSAFCFLLNIIRTRSAQPRNFVLPLAAGIPLPQNARR